MHGQASRVASGRAVGAGSGSVSRQPSSVPALLLPGDLVEALHFPRLSFPAHKAGIPAGSGQEKDRKGQQRDGLLDRALVNVGTVVVRAQGRASNLAPRPG